MKHRARSDVGQRQRGFILHLRLQFHDFPGRGGKTYEGATRIGWFYLVVAEIVFVDSQCGCRGIAFIMMTFQITSKA